jgi:hypothetical protein
MPWARKPVSVAPRPLERHFLAVREIADLDAASAWLQAGVPFPLLGRSARPGLASARDESAAPAFPPASARSGTQRA